MKKTTLMDYDFVNILPKRVRKDSEKLSNIIRVSFRKRSISAYVVIYIGINISKHLNLVAGDRASLFYDKNNPRIWFIEKSKVEYGYKIVDAVSKLGTKASSFRLQLTWNKDIFNPENEIYGIREVNSEIYEDGILINLDKKII